MATRKRASRERARRSRDDSASVVPLGRQPTTVGNERRALMRADAILRCVAVAMEYEDWSLDEPDYAEAIEVARNLILQSIERLEPHSNLSIADTAHSKREGRHRPRQS